MYTLVYINNSCLMSCDILTDIGSVDTKEEDILSIKVFAIDSLDSEPI